MNLVSARLVEIFVEGGIKKGKVQVGGAYTNVALTFVDSARVGDMLLIDAGVAIGILSEPQGKETPHVSGNSG
ncbi:MAG TPA: HypC/HybG/HupF family hydrogenase formation chaperone [Bacteroidota bacterium]|nr:HypC/HybG/HupF family hydrogenase formation chaperone [Bacteroidota bacterium]